MKRYPLIDRIAAEEGLNPNLAHAVFYNEHDPAKGLATTWGDGGKAYGPGQLHEAAAKEVGVNRFDLEDNLRGMVRYYKRQLDATGNPLAAAVAYNRGPGMMRQIAAGQAPEDQVKAGDGYARRFFKHANELFGIKSASANDEVLQENDVQRAYRALRAADKAGATEDARRIAQMIRGMESEAAGSSPAQEMPAPVTKAQPPQQNAPAAVIPPHAQSGASGSWEAPGMSTAESFGTGLLDPLHGSAQALAHAVPSGVAGAVNSGAEWLNRNIPITKSLGMTPATPEQLDASMAQREAGIQAQRGPDAGIDWGRAAGNVVGTLPVAAAMPGGPVMSSALSGAATGAMMPVTDGDFAEQKALQTAVGGLGGAAGGALMSGASRLIAPRASTSPAVQSLMAEGVTPTPGQMLGGAWNKAEQKLQSVPFSGDIITGARKRAEGTLNRAAFNRALEPIGEKSTADLGREAVEEVATKLGDKYDALLPKISFTADAKLGQKLTDLAAMAKELPPAQAARFNQVVDDIVLKRFDSPTATVDGLTFKGIQEKVRDLARGYKSSGDPDQRMLGKALDEVQTALDDGLLRSNPKLAKELKAVNKGWRQYAIVRDAAGRIGADEGVFTPAQLQSAVRAGDKSVGHGQFAKGKAMMQDLSEAGKSVLGSTVPNSGTADRLMQANVLGLGTGAATALPAAAFYSPMGQRAMASLLARRPGAATSLAPALRAGEAASPYLAPGGVAELLRQYGIGGR